MPLPGLPLAAVLADLICPERCAACDVISPPAHVFCSPCMTRVHRLGPPECRACGRPDAGDRCGPGCIGTGSPIRTARAWATYRDGSDTSPVAEAIARFKYGGAQRLGRRFAAAMRARIDDPTIDVVLPVPLYAQRLRERGYNQSAILARHLARALGLRVVLTAVTRTRSTPSQVTVHAAARAANVAGAFTIRRPDLVRGRTVLLVDDVWTSGATARSVASALRDAGTVAVDVLTFARVL